MSRDLDAIAVPPRPVPVDLTYKQCPHASQLGAVRVDLCANVAQPWNWRCADLRCGTTESLWLCCACGAIGCGRGVNCHAEKHHALHGGSAHCVIMALNDGIVFCYACDEWVFLEDVGSSAAAPLATTLGRRTRQAAATGVAASSATGGLAGLLLLRSRLLALLAGHEAPGVGTPTNRGVGERRVPAKPHAVSAAPAASASGGHSSSVPAPPPPQPLQRLPSYSTRVEAEMLARDRDGTADSFRTRSLQRLVLAALRRCVEDAKAERSHAAAGPAASSPHAAAEESPASQVAGSAPPWALAAPAHDKDAAAQGSSAQSSGASSPHAPVTAYGVTKRIAAGLIPGRCGLRNMGNTCFLSSVVVGAWRVAWGCVGLS